jgi:hypothetical protein
MHVLEGAFADFVKRSINDLPMIHAETRINQDTSVKLRWDE